MTAPTADGLLTFLFTDIEGSTRRWEEDPSTMRLANARHDDLVEQVVEQHDGEIVRSRAEGDSAFAVFTDPAAAVAAAVELQCAFAAEPWPGALPVLVRMAVHTGPAPHRHTAFYGPVVNRCARLRGIAHGGQILASGVTASLVAGRLPPGVELIDRGRHRLKDLLTPEHVHQVVGDGLPRDFPPLKSLDQARHNLADIATATVGRAAEVDRITRLLDDHAVVTVVGVGGVGKTRVAREVAHQAVSTRADGVWWADLADLGDPGDVALAAAAAVGIRAQPGRAVEDTLAEHVAGRDILLVLDNCEHVVAGAARVAERLVRAGPAVRVLATSRARLGAPGEAVASLAPLPTDDAAQLFRQAQARALTAASGRAEPVDGAPDDDDGAVGAICARLEGIPLAIEMAAAQTAYWSPREILAGLEERLSTSLPGQASPQETLRATIDWSYALLSHDERTLLRRLSVFAGFSLEAAERVAAGDDLEEFFVLDVLARLVDASLVVAEDAAGDVRYRLLETIREYAADQLRLAHQFEALHDSHLQWCTGLARDQEARNRGHAGELATALDTLDLEHDNLRAALRWGLDRERADAIELTWRLSWFWETRGHWSEALRWLDAAAALRATPWDVRVEVLGNAGVFAERLGDADGARRYNEELLSLCRTQDAALAGDSSPAGRALRQQARIGIGHALTWLGERARVVGDVEEARRLLREALDTRLALERWAGAAQTLAALGSVEWTAGDTKAARSLYEESLSLYERAGHVRGAANMLGSLGRLARVDGDMDTAARYLEQSLSVRTEIDDRPGAAQTLFDLAAVDAERGLLDKALARASDARSLAHQVGDRQCTLLATGLLASVHLRNANAPGAAVAMREALSVGPDAERAELLADWAVSAAGGGLPHVVAVLIGALDGAGSAVASDGEAGRAAEAAKAALGASDYEKLWRLGRDTSIQGLPDVVTAQENP